jgi:hypothetical protein
MRVNLVCKILVREVEPSSLPGDASFDSAFDRISGKILSSVEHAILKQDLRFPQPGFRKYLQLFPFHCLL